MIEHPLMTAPKVRLRIGERAEEKTPLPPPSVYESTFIGLINRLRDDVNALQAEMAKRDQRIAALEAVVCELLDDRKRLVTVGIDAAADRADATAVALYGTSPAAAILELAKQDNARKAADIRRRYAEAVTHSSVKELAASPVVGEYLGIRFVEGAYQRNSAMQARLATANTERVRVDTRPPPGKVWSDYLLDWVDPPDDYLPPASRSMDILAGKLGRSKALSP